MGVLLERRKNMAVSMEQKKKNAKQMSIYMAVVIGGLVFLYYLFKRQIALGIFFGSLAGVVTYFFMNADSARNLTYSKEESSGSGGFMTEKDLKDYNDKFIDPEPPVDKNHLYEPSPNMIMSYNFKRPVKASRLIGNNSILVVGAAGTGKSRFFIKPNILQLNCSFIITDPSGEMISATGTMLKEAGYEIKIFNISDMQHSNCYNPLHYIRNEAGVSMLVDCLIKNTTSDQNSGGDQFFTNAEKLLYCACIFYLKDHCTNVQAKNFPSIMSLINASKVNENNPNEASELDKLFETVPKTSLAYKYYKAFKQASGKTLKSIIISCVTRLQPFLTPQVINLTKKDTLELEKMGDRKTALFIITPQADRTYSFLASMLYSQAFETWYYIGEQQKAHGGSEALKVPIRCLMDEFANIGEVPEFPSKLSTMRKYNISATVILQDLSQIEALYKDNWRELISNCSSLVYLGATEQNTLKYFSDKLGEMTITTKSRGTSQGKNSSTSANFQQTARKVMTEDELARLPADECIVYTHNYRAIRDKKYKLEKHPRYSLLADSDNDPRAYKYIQMPEYDNVNGPNIDSLLRAQLEIAQRDKKIQRVSDPQNIKNVSTNLSSEEAIDSIQLDGELTNNIFNDYYGKAMNYILDHIDDDIIITTLNNIQPKLLSRIVYTVATQSKKSPIVIFTDNTLDNYYYGWAIDINDNDLTKTLKYCANIKKYDHNMYKIKVRKDMIEEYKEVLAKKFSNQE